MASGASKTPAWRRLGLTLKNEIGSGLAVADSQSLPGHLQEETPYDALNATQDGQSLHESTIKGKSSKLGKRKHQHDPAEHDDQTAKRGKKSTSTPAIESAVPTAIETIVESENAATITSDEPAAGAANGRPKGDPNYRKKKAKGDRKRRELDTADQELAPNDGAFLSLEAEKQQSALLASTETNYDPVPVAVTPQKSKRGGSKDSSGSPSGTERRKSVAFTPDTKKVDGSSAQNLFKKWVAEQKGSASAPETSESSVKATEAQLASPKKSAKISKSNEVSPSIQESATEQLESEKPADGAAASSFTEVSRETQSSAAIGAKGKKKDPSTYNSYLTQYYKDRDNWKFNKAKQNDVINNALNIFRIPEDHSDALLEYVQGLKGAGVVDRLKSNCEATLKELDAEDAKDTNKMDDPAVRKAAQEEALNKRIKQEQKRRKTDGDVQALVDHPNGDGYIRRLRRKRAEALLLALGRAAPILPVTPAAPTPKLSQESAFPMRDSRKRKRRGDISSDESSSDSSSSDESSSSESDSDDSDDDSDSDSDSDDENGGYKNNAASDSESDSDSDSSSSDNSSSDSEDDGSDDSGSDSESDNESEGSGKDSDSE